MEYKKLNEKLVIENRERNCSFKYKRQKVDPEGGVINL